MVWCCGCGGRAIALKGVVPNEEEDDEQEAREVEEGGLGRDAALAWGALYCWGVCFEE